MGKINVRKLIVGLLKFICFLFVVYLFLSYLSLWFVSFYIDGMTKELLIIHLVFIIGVVGGFFGGKLHGMEIA